MPPFQLSATVLAARRQAQFARLKTLRAEGVDGELVCKVANAMRDKRAELIAEPLSRCWERLALVALETAAED